MQSAYFLSQPETNIMRDQLTALWLICQIFFAVALADNAQNTTTTGSSNAETIVGWYAGPKDRGTLTLVYSCLATIITCTWTVLHLNVPALEDGPWTRGLRKAKWMAITILFPEFIFAKAICELRSALKDLFVFEKMLKDEYKDGLQCIFPGPYGKYQNYPDIICSWKVQFPRGRFMGLVYPLMGLPHPSLSLDGDHISARNNLIDEGSDGSNEHDFRRSAMLEEHHHQANTTEPAITESQNWTLAHSYLANMGGLLYHDQPSRQQKKYRYQILTGAKLSRRYGWRNEHHPLQSLVLSEDDINDRSKADWLLKTLSILQISWLVLNVITRYILKLPLTQLEIATLAFSVFAIATFTANWWKPKDISTPIRIPCSSELVYRGEGRLRENKDSDMHLFDWTRSFFARMLSPARTREDSTYMRIDTARTKNDTVEMEGNIPLLNSLMAIAGLAFGGLHCLAWNFQFPSRTELLMWRVASIASVIIPFISLVASVWLNYLVTGSLEKWLAMNLLPLSNFTSQYTDLLRRPAFLFSWDSVEEVAFYAQASGHRNFEVPPTEQQQEEAKKNQELWYSYLVTRVGMRDWHPNLCDFLDTWTNSRNDKPDAFTTYQLRVCYSLMKERNDLKEILEEYEKFYLQRRAGNPSRGLTCTEHIMTTMKLFEKKLQTRTAITNQASSMVAIISGILYTAARLIILVLLFTSLRDVPVGVYASTPWTRFLPSFS